MASPPSPSSPSFAVAWAALAPDEAVERVTQLAEAVLASTANLNALLALLAAADAREVQIVHAALTALDGCFAVCSKRDGAFMPSDSADAAHAQVHAWLGEQHSVYVARLAHLLAHGPTVLQVAALPLLEKAAVRLGSTHVLVSALKALVTAQLSSPLVRALPRVLAYADIRLAVLHALRGMLETNPQGGTALENTFLILRSMPTPNSDLDALITSPSSASLRKAHERTWRVLLAQPLSSDVHAAALEALPTHVLPFCAQPLKLLDFLAASADRGGEGALYALQALATLMAAHALDYPRYYAQLYALLASPLWPEHASAICALILRSLRSPLLPAYLPCAFAKRLARVALASEPHLAVIALDLLRALLVIHAPIHTLVHHQPSLSDGSLHLALAADPFDPHATTPGDSKAAESSLWELKALAQHHVPAVSAAAKRLMQPLGKELHELSGTTHEDLWAAEFARKVKRGVPLAYEEPVHIFDGQDFAGWSVPSHRK